MKHLNKYRMGLLNNSKNFQIGYHHLTPSRVRKERGCSKRPVQQGRRADGARSVHAVREHDNGLRTPLADFFNSPRMFFLGFVLCSVGCSTPSTEIWPPKAGDATKEIYVSLDTWHAMIGFTREDIQADGLHQPSFEEWGYAEQEWYIEGNQGVTGVLRALFWPSDGVVEVAKYDQLWATRTPQPPSDLFTFQVSQQGYQQLRDHLRSTRASPNPVARGRGSRFYQSINAYHVFHHCHHYVARALQEAGLPISVFWAFTRTGVASQLKRAEEIQTMNNNGVNEK